MNLPDLFHRVSKITTDNAPTILSAVAISGTLATAYLTGRATFKAAEIIQTETLDREKQQELSELPVPEQWHLPLTFQDKVKLVWPQYLAPAGVVVTTVGCIVFAQKINAKRLAGMAIAYSLSEKRFEEYKNKALEKLGVNKERTMRDEMAQENVAANPPSSQIVIMGGGDVLFQDSISGRYFMCDVESVRKTVNDLNATMMHQGEVTLSDFYDKLELAPTKFSDEVGWRVEAPIEVYFHTTIADNNRPCMVMDFRSSPIPLRGHGFRD